MRWRRDRSAVIKPEFTVLDYTDNSCFKNRLVEVVLTGSAFGVRVCCLPCVHLPWWVHFFCRAMHQSTDFRSCAAALTQAVHAAIIRGPSTALPLGMPRSPPWMLGNTPWGC